MSHLTLVSMSHILRVRLTVFLAVILTVWSAPCRADTTVTADVDRTDMDPGDLVTFSVSVNTDGDLGDVSDPVLPDLSAFETVKQWVSQSVKSGVVITGDGPEFQTRAIKTYSFVLQPRREGTLSLGGVEVTIAGKKYVTQPVRINVAKGASTRPNGQANGGRRGGQGQPNQPGGGRLPPMPPGFPEDLLDDEDDLFAQLLRRQGVLPPQGGHRSPPANDKDIFFVQVEVDKTDVYQDEQVTASWYLYTRGQIRDLDTLKYPSLSGFWKEDIEIATQLNFQQEILNGVPYRKALLASFALFPIKAGTSIVDPYKVRCSVFDTADAFGLFSGGQVRQYTKMSQPVKISVKPLPTEGRPTDFSGAVGSYQVTARVEDPNVVVGEPFALRVRFEGRGNAKRIDLPPLNLPPQLELYETQKEAKFFRTGTGYRDFVVLLIPRQEGALTIPPITASFFDPALGKYITASTQPLTVIAASSSKVGKLKSDRLATTGQKATAENVEPSIEAVFEAHRPWSTRQQGILFLILSIAAVITLLWKASRELGWGQRKRDLQRRLQARFRRINHRVQAGDWRGVGVETTNTVYFILGEISGQGGANVELEKLMKQAPPSVRRELGEPVLKLMDPFQALSFAPDDVVKKLMDPERIKKLVGEMQVLLEKAVLLGLSAERDDAFEKGPKAS